MARPVRALTCFINNSTLNDIVAAHLYAMTIVNDDEEVLELTLGEPNGDGIRSIDFKLIKQREVELIVHS